MELQDKIAVVTGAGQGIGRAIAIHLAEAGASVAAADINAETVEDTSAVIAERGGQSLDRKSVV